MLAGSLMSTTLYGVDIAWRRLACRGLFWAAESRGDQSSGDELFLSIRVSGLWTSEDERRETVH